MQCPGQDSRYWTGSAVFESACEKCGAELEFFKDDSTRVCKKCGHRMLNPKLDFGCASYCPYASQCLGELPPELLKKKQEELVEEVAVAIKTRFGDDFRRIGHAGRVARHAAELATDLKGANPAVVRIAAYLHDLYHPGADADSGTTGGTTGGDSDTSIGTNDSNGSSSTSDADANNNARGNANDSDDGCKEIRQLLAGLDANPGLTEEVCRAVEYLHQPPDQGADSGNSEQPAINFSILSQAHQRAATTE